MIHLHAKQELKILKSLLFYMMAFQKYFCYRLPEATAPQFSLISSLVLDAFSIAIVSYTITLSMGLIFAQKMDYEIDANQELLAMVSNPFNSHQIKLPLLRILLSQLNVLTNVFDSQGTGNIFGSFFSCMPVCASLSRSVIQSVVGGKTQLVSLVSCGILIFILVWIGPFFEPLPQVRKQLIFFSYHEFRCA